MANRKRLLIRSERIDKQKPENDLRQELDFEYLVGTRERAEQWVTDSEGCTGPGKVPVPEDK